MTITLSDIAQGEYSFEKGPDGSWSAPNRAQGLRTRADVTGVHLTSRGPAPARWELALRLRAFGREGGLLPVPPAVFRAKGARVEQVRASLGLTEWYVNEPRGIEQGFTISGPPPAGDPGSRLVLEIAHTGDLAARADGEDAIAFAAPDGTVALRQSGLVVFDALGRRVPAEMRLVPGAIRIAVSDQGRPYPLVVDPTIVTPDWTAFGDQFEEQFGASVSGAGDVNGDGYADVIVGAPRFDGGSFDEGRAFVFLGSPTGPAAQPAWTADGGQAGAWLGYSVASAGDVNGDGYADVIVGARLNDNLQVDEGRAFVFLGSAAGLDTVPVWTAEPDQNGARFGSSVASAGDVNGDGYDDVVVGAPEFDTSFNTDEGQAFLYLGSAAGPSASPAWSAGSGLFGSAFGFSVASAGDVNRDGFDDVIVGAPLYDNAGFSDEGRAFVYGGSASGLSPNPLWTADSGRTLARLGHSVASAGDVNLDGFADVIVGAPFYDSGRAFVYHGSPAGPSLASDWFAKMTVAPAEFGASVAGVGDLDGDGYGDVVIGAPRVDDRGDTAVGLIRAFYGGAMGLGNQAALSAQEIQPNALLGGSVARAGDVNRDGLGDIIAGAIGLSNAGLQVESAGGAHLYLGFRTGSCSPVPETCNNIDDDCDGQVDEGLGTTTCGTGACTTTVDACVGGVPQACTPGTPAAETCNNIDDDCDGSVDDGLGTTGCGTGACARTVDNCAGGVPQSCTPGTPAAEACNDIDDDCDGAVDEDFDVDRDGFTTCAGDCNDSAATIHPGAPEICNGTDDNCNLTADEGFPDSDGDGLNDCIDPDDDDDLVADVSDCAPLVSSVSSIPGEVGQTVRSVAGGPSGAFSWTRIAQANVHDVYRSTWNRLTGAWNATLVCLVSESTGSSFSDTSNPPGGSAYFYVITGTNRCGEGTAGSGSDGQPRAIPSHCAPQGLDTDVDAVSDIDDNCPLLANAGQFDADHDGRGNACDNCSAAPNPGQEDADGNGTGDICQDLDHDGYTDDVDCNDNDPAIYPGSTEVCNGADDDCDGATDESLGSTTCGIGPCTRTVANCAAGVPQTCTPGAPGTETCNGLDDDCDGTADDNLGNTTCGLGMCARTVTSCVAGVPQTCTPGTPGTETCNGLDDDCDGAVDDEFVPTPTTCGTGACASTGTTACVGGVVIDTCTPSTPQTVAVDFGSSMAYHANISGPPEGRALIEAGSPMRYLANAGDPGIGLLWAGGVFDDSSWAGGPSGAPYGVGYETGPAPNAVNLIQTPVPAGTYSVYTRARFSIADASTVRGLFLGADFDDGFVAYINGVEVARSSMPAGDPAWNTNATLHESSNGTTPSYGTLIDISAAALPVLRNGANVLAIGVWNSNAPASTDLVLVPKLAVALDWTDEAYAAASWSVGSYGVGYDTATAPPDASSLFLTAVPAGTLSVYTRVPFTVTNPEAITGIFFGADFDDGFVAYLNGFEVTRAFMPAGTPDWNTNAALHESSNGATPNFGTPIDISTAARLLHAGTNLLAVGVWNSGGSTSSDLVLVPRLTLTGNCGP